MASRRTSLSGIMQRVLSEALASCSDRQLLERYAYANDESAFAALLDRHGPMLLGLCRRLLGDRHLAEDVVQAAFLVLARKARSIRRRDSLASWLYGVAQRLSRQTRLTQAARERREQRAAREHPEAIGTDPAAWDELLTVLDEELQRLPERYRAPLILCYLEGHTQDEAARQLRWSLRTLRRRLAAGRELLRTRMIRRGATLGAGLFASILAPSAVRAALTAELRRAILGAAVGGAISETVAMLVKGGIGMGILMKLTLWSALTVAVGGLIAGGAWLARSTERPVAEHQRALPEERADKPPVTVQAKEQAEPLDRFNDPLPKEAVARLGTVAFRHGRITGDSSLTFTPDGKHLISAGGGWVRRWNVATGREERSVGDGWRSIAPTGATLVAADGKLARICIDFTLRQDRGPIFKCAEYDLESGKERVYRLEYPEGTKGGYAVPRNLSPDGKTLVGFDNQRGGLTLWDAESGGFYRYLNPPSGCVYTALAFTPDSKCIIVGDEVYDLRIYIPELDVTEPSFGPLDRDRVAQMAVSPDGQWLATAGTKKMVRIWDLKEKTQVRTLDFPEEGGVRALLFTPDSRTLIAATQQGYESGWQVGIRTWEIATGKPGRVWANDPALGSTLAISPDGKTLATMNQNGVIRLWDWETGQERSPAKAAPSAVATVGFHEDGKTILTVGADATLRAWDAATGGLLDAPRFRVTGSAPRFWAGGKFLATGQVQIQNGRQPKPIARLYDTATGKLRLEKPGLSQIAVSPDSEYIATGAEFHVQILDGATSKLLIDATGSSWANSRLVGWGRTQDGPSLILQQAAVVVWDAQTGKNVSTWYLELDETLGIGMALPATGAGGAGAAGGDHRAPILEAIVASPDGSKLALAGSSREGLGNRYSRIVLLETSTGELLQRADIHDEILPQLAFSPDGKMLAVGGPWSVRVWDVESWKEVQRFEGHRGRVTSLAFSPDGKRLASASEDSTVLIWDVAR